MTQISTVQFALWCFLVPLVPTIVICLAKDYDRGAWLSTKCTLLIIWTQIVIKTTLTLMIQ